MKILFMCVANSARSQMAEGLARKLLKNVEIASAGSVPQFVHPMAQKALAELGIDTLRHSSKSWEQLPQDFRENLNYVITLCAEEVCPIAVTQATRLHWPMPDPAAAEPGEQLQRFRQVRDEIQLKIEELAKSL